MVRTHVGNSPQEGAHWLSGTQGSILPAQVQSVPVVNFPTYFASPYLLCCPRGLATPPCLETFLKPAMQSHTHSSRTELSAGAHFNVSEQGQDRNGVLQIAIPRVESTDPLLGRVGGM